MKTPTSSKDKTEETGPDNVGAILDDAMKQMKLAQHFPGKDLELITAGILCQVNKTSWLAHFKKLAQNFQIRRL